MVVGSGRELIFVMDGVLSGHEELRSDFVVFIPKVSISSTRFSLRRSEQTVRT